MHPQGPIFRVSSHDFPGLFLVSPVSVIGLRYRTSDNRNKLPLLKQIASYTNLSWGAHRDDISVRVNELRFDMRLHPAHSLNAFYDRISWNGLERDRADFGLSWLGKDSTNTNHLVSAGEKIVSACHGFNFNHDFA
jgi:hypothetical protein